MILEAMVYDQIKYDGYNSKDGEGMNSKCASTYFLPTDITSSDGEQIREARQEGSSKCKHDQQIANLAPNQLFTYVGDFHFQ